MYGLWSRPMGSLHIAYIGKGRTGCMVATQLEFSRLAAIEM